jgi:hypothetical protein
MRKHVDSSDLAQRGTLSTLEHVSPARHIRTCTWRECMGSSATPARRRVSGMPCLMHAVGLEDATQGAMQLRRKPSSRWVHSKCGARGTRSPRARWGTLCAVHAGRQASCAVRAGMLPRRRPGGELCPVLPNPGPAPRSQAASPIGPRQGPFERKRPASRPALSSPHPHPSPRPRQRFRP